MTKAVIKSLRRKGMTYSKIADIAGVSRQRIEQILHKDKAYARSIVQKELKMGRLNRKFCEYPDCKQSSLAEAHHPDYENPLDIIWLCTAHHKELHTNLRPKVIKLKISKCLTCGKEMEYTTVPFKFCKKHRVKHRNRLYRRLYHNDPKRKEAVKRYNKAWRKNNPDKVAVIQKRATEKYRTKNKEMINEKQRLRNGLRYKIDKDYREKILAYNRAKYWENKGKVIKII